MGAHAPTKFHAGGQCPQIILQQQVNGKAVWSSQLKSMLASKQTLNERRSLSLVYTVTLTFARRMRKKERGVLGMMLVPR